MNKTTKSIKWLAWSSFNTNHFPFQLPREQLTRPGTIQLDHPFNQFSKKFKSNKKHTKHSLKIGPNSVPKRKCRFNCQTISLLMKAKGNYRWRPGWENTWKILIPFDLILILTAFRRQLYLLLIENRLKYLLENKITFHFNRYFT